MKTTKKTRAPGAAGGSFYFMPDAGAVLLRGLRVLRGSLLVLLQADVVGPRVVGVLELQVDAAGQRFQLQVMYLVVRRRGGRRRGGGGGGRWWHGRLGGGGDRGRGRCRA